MNYRIMVARRVDSELYHHGIKGMKWGIRRFQKKDGSLTSAGKKRYTDDDPSKPKKQNIPTNKSKYRLKLEEKYRSEGLTKQEAEQAAARRIKAEKFVVAAAGITVASCAVYYAHKKYAVDRVISKDAGFQRIMRMSVKDTVRQGPMYMAYDKNDKIKYKGILGSSLGEAAARESRVLGEDNVFKFKITPHEDIKVASPKRAKDTFRRLFETNEEFRDAATKSMNELYESLPNGKQKDLLRKATFTKNNGQLGLGKKAYDAFNVNLANKSSAANKAKDIFYEDLRKQGVNAVQDLNDVKYSGYRAKDPLIMFGGGYKWTREMMRETETISSLQKSRNILARQELAEAGKKYAALYGGLGTAVIVPPIVGDSMAVKNYKKKHPNTRMSDSEILKMLQN